MRVDLQALVPPLLLIALAHGRSANADEMFPACERRFVPIVGDHYAALVDARGPDPAQRLFGPVRVVIVKRLAGSTGPTPGTGC